MASFEFGAKVVLGASLANDFGAIVGSAEKTIGAFGKAVERALPGRKVGGDAVRLGSALEGLRQRQQEAGGASVLLGGEIARTERAFAALARRVGAYGLEIGRAAEAQRRFSKDLVRGQAQSARPGRREARREGRPVRRGPITDAPPSPGFGAGRFPGKAMEIEEKPTPLQTVSDSDDDDTVAAAPRARGQAAAPIARRIAVAVRGDSDQVAAIIGAAFHDLRDSVAGADPAEKIGRIGEILTRVRQKIAIGDFGRLGEGLAEIAAAAIRARLPFEQAVVALGRMNDAGTAASRAGAALHRVPDLLPAAAAAPGLSADRSSGGSLGLAASPVASGVSRPEGIGRRARPIGELFGDDGSRGSVSFLENLDAFRDAVEAAGGFESAYASIPESASAPRQMAGQNLQGAGAAIADTLQPVVGWVSDLRSLGADLKETFDALRQFRRQLTLTNLKAKALAVGGALRRFGTSVLDTARTARGGLARLGRQLTLTNLRMRALAVGGAVQKFGSALIGLASGGIKAVIGGLRALGAAIAANPIGLIVTAVVLAAALIWKYWEPIKAFFGRLFAPLVEFARPVFAWISAKVSAVAGWIYARLRPVAAFYGRVFGAIVEFLRPVFAWIGAKIAAIVGWVRKALAVVGPAFAVLLGPIGLLIGAAALIWKYWEPIKAFFARLFAPLVEFARPILAWIGGKVSAVAGWIFARLRPVGAFFGRVFGAVLEFLRPVFAWIGAKIAAVVGWVRKALGVVGPAFAVLLGPIGLLIGAAVLLWKFWEPIKGFFAGLWNGIAAGASAAFGFLGRIWEGVKGAFSGLRSVVQGAVGAVVSWLENFSLADIGKNLLATVGDGILAAKDAVVEKVGAVFGAVRNLLPFSDAREGPFARLTTSGAAILGTVGEGVRRAGPGPLRRPLQSALGAAVVGLGVPAAASGISALPAGAPPAPPAGAAPAKQIVVSPGAVSPGAIVLHFHGPTDDPAWVAREVERQLADLFRRAANEARLLETDDA